MKISSELEFAWSNVFKPTPRNVELGLRMSRRMLGAIGGSTFLASKAVIDPSYDWVMFWLVVVQVGIEELSMYIGEASKPGTKQVTKIETPAEIADKVKITQEVVEEDEEKEVDDTNTQ